MATWSGVITNSGNGILNEWVNGKTLNFDGAAAGQGTVAEKAMMAQTTLVSQKQTASLLGGEEVSMGIRLKIRIAAPETAYTLNQYGVWASVTGGPSVMIALFQIEEGIPIPSKTESPDFVYTFYALVACSNAGTWTVNVDTSTSVTIAEMTAAIAESEQIVQANLNSHINNKTNPHGVTAAQAGAIPTSQKGAAGGVASLGSDGKVPAGQLPDMDYDPAGSAQGVQDNLNTHTNNKSNPHGVTAAQAGAVPTTRKINNKALSSDVTLGAADVGAIPSTQKGTAGGVASLGSDGKVPAGQLPDMDYDPAGSAQGVQNNLNTHTNNKSNPHGVTAAQIGAVPTTRKVNNKALSADVSLSAADVGALPISGGTLTGNLDGKYIKGTWLQSTASNHLSGAATKICVQDQDGWVYHRTAAEILSDIGVPAAIQFAIGNAMAASY